MRRQNGDVRAKSINNRHKIEVNASACTDLQFHRAIQQTGRISTGTVDLLF